MEDRQSCLWRTGNPACQACQDRRDRLSSTVQLSASRMRPALLVVLLASSTAHAQTFRLSGFLDLRGIYTRSQPSWLNGGFGRFETGARTATGGATTNVDLAQIGADWTPLTWLDLHVSGVARHERTAGSGQRSAGLVDAFVARRKEFGANQLQLRAGQFF